MRSHHVSNAFWFVAGVSFGAAIGLLIAPTSGAETRKYLGDHASSARDYVDRGRDLYERGRELADEAAQMYEDGRHLIED